MTLVITHANGFLGCFTQKPDGSMVQRALIDTGDQDATPQALADLGMKLAHEYGWQLNGASPPVSIRTKRVKALPVVRERDTSDPPTERGPKIYSYLIDHSYSTIKEVMIGLGYDGTQERHSRWHHTFHALKDSGKIDRRQRASGTGRRNEWYVTHDDQT